MGEAYSLQLEKVIPGPIEEVFDAWLDPDSLNKWMIGVSGGIAVTRTDPVVGGKFSILMKANETEILHEGEYRLIQRPEKLAFTRNSPYSDNTLVTIDFESLSPQSTRVRLTHERFPDRTIMETHRGGWESILSAFEKHMNARTADREAVPGD